MIPSKQGSAKGGMAKTARKLAALKALHEARKGRRLNITPTRERETTLAAVATEVRKPRIERVRSLRAAAAYVHVDPRTLSRWLSGKCFPPAHKLRALNEWLRSLPGDR
jgi:transcriptional regulator with XRE-family HTH domain